MNVSRWISAFALLSLAIPASAAIFPDVPDGHIYQVPIEKLVGVQVISGNPDGTFKPEDPVNRAAMLKMLYKAAGKTPDPARVKCFKDVPEGSWYEPYVCDAAFHRHVQGYNDGMFKPGNPVTRAEGLKMMLLLLGIEVPEITSLNRELVKFVDISTSAWYTKYFSAAFNKALLPIDGWGGARLYPDWPLLRGEAASYIQNGLDLKLEEDRAHVAEEMMESTTSSVGSTTSQGSTTSTAGGSQASEAKSSMAASRNIKTNYPLNESGTFTDKAAVSYEFDLIGKKLVHVVVSMKQGSAGKVTCRLYKMESSGFSNEYYLGYQEDQQCYVLAALGAGSYQLQVQPTTPNTEYSVSAQDSNAGDGNDGFAEARGLERGNLRTEVLSPNDYEDWFKFTVGREAEMTLSIISGKTLRCLIYPGSSIDLFGFTGPECGKPYLYPAGTYIVGVGHVSPRAEKQTYTIQLK